jgi:hypothetical protein
MHVDDVGTAQGPTCQRDERLTARDCFRQLIIVYLPCLHMIKSVGDKDLGPPKVSFFLLRSLLRTRLYNYTRAGVLSMSHFLIE